MTRALEELAALPIVERLGWTLIHSVWQVMIVSVIVAGALRLFRNATANARYAGLCAGLLIAAAAPAVTFICLPVDARPDSLSDVLKVNPAASPGASASQFINGAEVTASDQPGVADPDARAGAEGQRSSGPSISLHPFQGTAAARQLGGSRRAQTTAVSTLRMRIKSAAPWIVAVWILGVGLFSVWHMAGWMLARRLATCGTRPVAATIQSMLEGLMRRMGIRASVRLLESTATSVPIVVGWLKPVLLLPASVLSGLPPDHLQAILAHELAHVRRHDILVNLLQTVVETCLFYHPAVWWMSRQIRTEREYCADEEAAAVCQDRDVYARALISLADSVTAVPSLTVAATGGSLTRRIHRVLGLTSGGERLTRHPWWLVSAVLGLTVFCGLLASTKSSAQLQNQARVEITPIKSVADRLVPTLKGWKLLEIDEQPSVAVNGHRGFRLVLRRTWKEFTNLPQQQKIAPQSDEADGPFELRHEDWEFVLIPVLPKPAPAATKSQIKWQKDTSPYHTRDICLGEGMGYVWFTHGTLFWQDYAREYLKLEGGDDRIQLAVDGLLVTDVGTTTANSCQHIAAQFGDRALPYIERTIDEAGKGDDLWRVVGSLAFIQTDRSTDLLLKLFDSEDDDAKRAAQYALIHEPYRKAAKRAYFDMLRRQSSVDAACRACVAFQWKDAVPILRDLIASPRHLRELADTIRARRRLEGRPIAQELLDAEQTLHSLMSRDRDAELGKQIDSARRLLIQTDDSEAANLAALSLAIMTSKGGAAPVNEAGIEIFKSRPRKSTVAFLKSLAAGVHEEYRPQAEKLLNAVTNAAAPAGADPANPP